MKVLLQAVFGCPARGCAQPGQVLDVDEAEAVAMVAGRYAAFADDADAEACAAKVAVLRAPLDEAEGVVKAKKAK
jgi:hypothetical protein